MPNIIEKQIEAVSNDTNFSLEKLTVQQLLDLTISSYEDAVGFNSRNELIKRGSDNIEVRISIKKACKASVASYESSQDKAKLLSSITLLDKLQLEWQKLDLILKNH